MSDQIVEKKWKVGDQTEYGMIVERRFGEEGTEIIPHLVHHLPDTSELRLNQFVYVNEAMPWKVEAWCTQSPSKGAPGTWDGPRKLRTMKLVDAGVYPEFCLLETNLEGDHTVGTVGPLVAVLNDGTQFVAVNPSKNRRGFSTAGVVEAMRQRHGSQDPKSVATDGVGMITKEYGPNELGIIITNSACIHAETADGEILPAFVRPELTVQSNIDRLPDLNKPFVWIPLAEYVFLTLDTHGQKVVTSAIVAGYLSKPSQEIVDGVLGNLPGFVAEVTK